MMYEKAFRCMGDDVGMITPARVSSTWGSGLWSPVKDGCMGEGVDGGCAGERIRCTGLGWFACF